MEREKSTEYYNGDKLLSRHFMVSAVCGSRFGGKSTWVQRYVLKRAIRDHDNQFALLIRHESHINKMCPTYFDNTMSMWYPDYSIELKKRKYYITDNRTKEKWLAGYVFALSEATKMKSSSYPLINTMIYEEFINIEGDYIKNKENPNLEAELLISIIQTVFRGKGKRFRDNGRVLCISNAYSLNNPICRYFNVINNVVKNPWKQFYEIKPTYDKKGNIDKPAMLLEIVYNAIDDGFGSANSGSNWTDFRNELHLAKKPKIKDDKVIFQLTFDNELFLNIAPYNDSKLVYKSKKGQIEDAIVYSCADTRKLNIYSIALIKNMYNWKSLINAYYKNDLYYDSYESYIAFKCIAEFA